MISATYLLDIYVVRSVSTMIVRLKNNTKMPISTLKKNKNFKERKNIQNPFNDWSTPDPHKKIKEKFQYKNKKSIHKNPIFVILIMHILIYSFGFIKR